MTSLSCMDYLADVCRCELHDELTAEAWERMTYGGAQVDLSSVGKRLYRITGTYPRWFPWVIDYQGAVVRFTAPSTGYVNATC